LKENEGFVGIVEVGMRRILLEDCKVTNSTMSIVASDVVVVVDLVDKMVTFGEEVVSVVEIDILVDTKVGGIVLVVDDN